MNFLENDKISLRAPEPSDLEYIYRCENDSSNWNLSNTSTPYNKETIFEHIKNSNLDIFTTKQYRFIIVIKATKKVAGIIDIFNYDPLHLRAECGIIISPNENKRKGIAYQSIELLKIYSFNLLMLNQLYCNISEANLASIALFKKAGFRKTGTKINWLNTENGFTNVFFFQCFQE